jgi:hypothetical protein
MAENQQNQQNPQDLNSAKINSYTKGLIKDYNDSFVPEGVWTNAINAVTNSHLGDTGTIGNEPSNVYCTKAPYEVIGIIRREASTWVIFSTNNFIGEIGIFNEFDCSYTKVVSSSCLHFRTSNLITGVVQVNVDCTYTVFFADGLNPDRALNLDRVPYQIQKYDTTDPDCPIPVYYNPLKLDCSKIRLHYLIDTPCFKLTKSISGGSLFNGSYQVAIAYSISGTRVTDYFSLSNIASIWTHENNGGSLDVVIDTIDTNFEEFQLVLISTVNEKASAKIIGYYSTTQTLVHIDNNNDTLTSVPLSDIPLNRAVYETSDDMFLLNSYLLRSGVKTKYDFNYQPLANQIVAKWVQVEYPADYYIKGNNNTGYLRDEIYSFFIRWVYKTGNKSASYHIPGRPPRTYDLALVTTSDVMPYDNNKSASAPRWMVYNTAITTGGAGSLPDGGNIKNAGYMAYWESTNKYPVKPEIYNASAYPWSTLTTAPYPNTQIADYDLCGDNIRHHKFPDDQFAPLYVTASNSIQILGVKFENIKPPVDLQGNLIEDVVGYEILRGSREGNKTIIAKGIINNMGQYSIPNQVGSSALYQNYPYNSLQNDYYLHQNTWYNAPGPQDHDDTGYPLNSYRRDYFSFHSPDPNFRAIYLNPSEIKVYTTYSGQSVGNFVEPYGHPKYKLPSQGAFIGSLLLGLGNAITMMMGQQTTVKGNSLSVGGQVGLQAAASAGAPGGNASSAAMTAIGGTGFYGQMPLVGTSTGGGAAGVNLGTINTTSTDFSILNPTSTKPDIISNYISRIELLLLVGTVGGYFLTKGFGTAMKAITELLPWKQYALQYNSHAFYNNIKILPSTIRRQVDKARYLDSNVQTFDTTYVVNNFMRPKAVIVKTINTIADPTVIDNSRQTVNQLKQWNDISKTVYSTASAHYAGLKVDFKNVYGQLSSIVQLPIGTCAQLVKPIVGKPNASEVYFNGDTYVNRYTEKNVFPLFTQWAFNLPNGTDFDYKLYANVPYPRYWATFEDLDVNDINLNWPIQLSKSPIKIIKSIINAFTGFISNPIGTITSIVTGPSNKVFLDRDPNSYKLKIKDALKKTFYIKNGYFYLFVNGVRDFFVESEINLACRDYGTLITEQFYNPYGYTNLYDLFRSDIINVPEFFKYDFSLSASKLVTNYATWGSVLPLNYDPTVAETCYGYFPNRLVYSLEQDYEQNKDNWRIFLPNNYKDFDNKITSVKSINRTGSVILFQDAIPTTINGVDELQTTGGVKITLGDAGLFNQPFQTLVNSDLELEYASCQDSRSVINTPYGVYWVSQKNGKIMQLIGNQVTDISMNGMRYWFTQNLKYNLLKQIPGYPHTDNPVKGVGCQTVYDNQYEIIYFSKKDYRVTDLRSPENPNGKVVYIPETGEFQIPNNIYSIAVNYTSGLELTDGDQIQGTIDGVTTFTCTYTAGETTTFIATFVKCLVDNIKVNSLISSVVSEIGATAFNITITPKDVSTPIPTIEFNIINSLGESAPIYVSNTETAIVDPTDSQYFEDCSWTISYDPKTKMWLSFHDWHPDLMFPSNDHFYTILDNKFWKHNSICNSYGNYYDKNYGWEIEFPVNTGSTITTIKSVEYTLEVLKFNTDCADPYHVLDGNFDQAVIYNTEQVSGYLNLHIKPKNNPLALLSYPKINLDSIDIHVAKEENKYRFNQFWDTTRDRGEFSGKQFTLFDTEYNGYRKNINPNAVNYTKSPLQRKKFRHYGNRLILRRFMSGDQKMNLKVVTTKETLSPR